MKCDICQREQIKIGTKYNFIIGNEKYPVSQYNIDIFTFINGIAICSDCMDTYNKIFALEHGVNFSWCNNEYRADGSNLRKKEN